jgi:putative flippase GtrA
VSLTFREKESKRLMKFIASGAASIVFSVGLLWVMTDIMGIFYITSGAVSKEIGIVFAFALSEFWVFNDRIVHASRTAKQSISRLLQFNINRLLSIVIVTVCMAIFTEFVGLNYLVSNMIGVAIAFPFNYVVSNKSIWKGNVTSKNADVSKNTDASKIVYMPENVDASRNTDASKNTYVIRDAILRNTGTSINVDIPESKGRKKW